MGDHYQFQPVVPFVLFNKSTYAMIFLQMPLYSLVDYGLTADNKTETELVPSIWLFKEEGQQFSWWPPKNMAISTAVKKRSLPVAASWKQYIVTRVVMEFGELGETIPTIL
jgi:hypothetical protein